MAKTAPPATSRAACRESGSRTVNLTYSVAEITISRKLQDMFQDTDMIGNDPVWRDYQAAPTFRMRKRFVSGT